MKERRTTAPAPASGPISLSAILGLNHLVLSKPPNAQDSKASRPAAKDNVEHTHSNILRDAASIIGCFLMLRPPSADMPEYGLERKFWKHPFVVVGCLIGECSRVLELQICIVNSFQWIQDRRQVRNFVKQKNQMARRYIPISPNPPSDLSNPKQVQVIQGDQLRHSSWVNIEKVYMIGKDAIDVSRFSELTRLTLNSLNDIRQALSMPRLTKFYGEPSSPEKQIGHQREQKGFDDREFWHDPSHKGSRHYLHTQCSASDTGQP
ncbi:hypothetical protein EDD37DRAFT_651947 [Exophiala viscosa]|uniref:uncharacterized protein n=1 Tax=Exophiala viscosa TaxID=2486360 RepID=UPI0021A16A85|nr:hypothetical protein EDD37DRAFT_651947 [Exophiala viscosa]